MLLCLKYIIVIKCDLSSPQGLYDLCLFVLMIVYIVLLDLCLAILIQHVDMSHLLWGVSGVDSNLSTLV